MTDGGELNFPNAGSLIFPEQGPYHLPVAQSATARALENNEMEMTVYVLVGGRDPDGRPQQDPQPVNIQMSVGVARQLADELVRAANKAEAE